ncbi:hypothetical protein P186_0067 [Pyrobaculum ferrireducens]|uniref:Uncharacterized protein n=1 Tax=Pyrobaculum ferrireducens TaxID=1104324 RepID=G7VDV4_9CREN|nr:hypothetical protein P186_0067 [Pyrobaculum ferrireducens]
MYFNSVYIFDSIRIVFVPMFIASSFGAALAQTPLPTRWLAEIPLIPLLYHEHMPHFYLAIC